ncbi:TPA: CTP synthase [archaeon]|uniref:CTP synthase n=1 Tax=Candidatus Naiadarchaeum limnaeum TaxID=2756139 RepID=A0A832XI46_9ARCH|nr:CTP synthase [Candidatus Naiadarchaeum limnaeum]
MPSKTKYIATTGGVISGLGKGLVSSSIGKILQSYGYDVTMVKIDPYINVDAGTMNPFEHGEVFVLEDGGEVDMDLGNYERFLNIDLTKDHNITTGKVYKAVIDKEREGDYLGKTVQIIPHVTDEIKHEIRKVARGHDICVIEVGGTVGDIESMPFLEALRQMRMEEGPENVVFVHVTLVPVLDVVGEQKTKPTQHSVQRLLESGIQPDFVVARSKKPLEEKARRKISNFCNVPEENVISDPDARISYEVPLILEKEGLGKKIAKKLNLKVGTDLRKWRYMVNRMLNPKNNVRIAMAGKYTALGDSYVSILEAVKHGALANNAKVEISWIETEDFEKDKSKLEVLDTVDGLIVPGGFGPRGVEGKILAVGYARTHKIPYLGLCYGMQMATIEFARNVCGMKGAHTTECAPRTKHPVLHILPEKYQIKQMGGTLRLGSWPCKIKKGTLAEKIYKSNLIHERHRHRYEVNPDYIEKIESKGLVFSGKHPERPLMEIAELSNHPFFIGTQYHPEFKSRPEKPSPIYAEFIKACINYKKTKRKS